MMTFNHGTGILELADDGTLTVRSREASGLLRRQPKVAIQIVHAAELRRVDVTPSGGGLCRIILSADSGGDQIFVMPIPEAQELLEALRHANPRLFSPGASAPESD